MTFVALTIAGSDPTGGAGLQADLRTFHQFGVYGAAVATLITVQNSMRVSRVETLDAGLVGEQLDAVLEDFTPQATKTGALGTAAIIAAIAERALPGPLIVDPVMISKHGKSLLDGTAVEALRRLLIPRAALITPNLEEAATLAGIGVHDLPSMREAARRIADLGAKAVLVKGGHLEGDAVDILFHNGIMTEFRVPRIESLHTHGTGCTYSAAITACVARGLDLVNATQRAKSFITEAIRTAPGLGKGSGPVNQFNKIGTIFGLFSET